ncbi:MAG: hypothetical protein IJU41_02005 [Clostridia bacterium]|nr:hypothetical protein [Clostridia bacterium]
MKKLHITLRLVLLAALFVLICAAYLAELASIQVVGQDYYDLVRAETTSRYVTVYAKRGEIYDRNGKPLVVNAENYNISLEYGAMPMAKADFNAMILDMTNAVIAGGGGENLTEPTFPFTGSYPDYEKDENFFESATNRLKFAALLRRLERAEDISTEDLIDYLRLRYGLASYDKKTDGFIENYTGKDADYLMRVRFAMEYIQFSRVQPYTLAEHVDDETLAYVAERSFAPFKVTVDNERTYVYPGYASHILGRIGKIPAEDAEAYKARGYSADAYVGISGAEKVYEEYLHGTDGLKEVVEDAYGNIVSETTVKEPVAGRDVRLTIDADLQIAAEDALADNITVIHRRAASQKPLNGEDASSGAAVAVDPTSGEVLAMASYPTFDLADYAEKYNELAADEGRPLLNRALYGAYTPGSTFKPGVAAGALNEGVITANTIIVDRGVYDFGGYRPRCWIYLQRGQTHGAQNVVAAIQNSCNYFFYEVGNRMGIDLIDKYAKLYGLGEPTGIELGESTGILASPAYSESVGNIWNPGNTLQAAIGQSDHMFTPLQLGMYISTILSGTRYKAHLLKEVVSFPDGEVVYETPVTVLDVLDFKPGILPLIKSAMKDVVESGSAARIFRGYDITVGGKTGTAQVGEDRSANALFVGFAPYDEPKIVTAIVIEQGANGTDAAYTAKAMFDTYLKGQPYIPLSEQ